MRQHSNKKLFLGPLLALSLKKRKTGYPVQKKMLFPSDHFCPLKIHRPVMETSGSKESSPAYLYFSKPSINKQTNKPLSMWSQTGGKTWVRVVRQLWSVKEQVKQVAEVLLQSCLVQVVTDDTHQTVRVIASGCYVCVALHCCRLKIQAKSFVFTTETKVIFYTNTSTYDFLRQFFKQLKVLVMKV